MSWCGCGCWKDTLRNRNRNDSLSFFYLFSFSVYRKEERKNIEKEIISNVLFIWAFVLIHALFLFFWVFVLDSGENAFGFCGVIVM